MYSDLLNFLELPNCEKILFPKKKKKINSFDDYNKIEEDAMCNYLTQSLKVEIKALRVGEEESEE